MENKTSEMSLDEVLSSIKKMVIDEEPPVLELTEMVSDDGSIVSIKKKNNDAKSENKSNDMSSFLKLIQEDVSEAAQEMAEMPAAAMNSSHIEQTAECGKTSVDAKIEETPRHLPENVLHELIREAITPLLKDWLDKNLPSVINKIVESEVKNFLYKNRN